MAIAHYGRRATLLENEGSSVVVMLKRPIYRSLPVHSDFWDRTCTARRIQQGYEAMKLNTRILSLEIFHCLLAAL
jgi:hypothetical protein